MSEIMGEESLLGYIFINDFSGTPQEIIPQIREVQGVRGAEWTLGGGSDRITVQVYGKKLKDFIETLYSVEAVPGVLDTDTSIVAPYKE